ncbi:tRNA adenosine(34) deaminase TadA [Alteromonadaceae bacterium M269]|nr:tRNA adenosine(34) deaminase TadA [Alteromonadaceae bacterium M269]
MKQEQEMHEFWMRKALQLADIAEQHDEVPVGAIVVRGDEIIGQGWNQSIGSHDPSAHAEMIAIREAGKKLANYRLIDCRLYVTLEPCPMCAGLLVHSRLQQVIFGAKDAKTGAAGSIINLVEHEALNHQLDVVSGVLADECGDKLSAFFKRRRAEKKQLKKLLKS